VLGSAGAGGLANRTGDALPTAVVAAVCLATLALSMRAARARVDPSTGQAAL